MKPGRKKKPTKVKKREGNPGGRKLNKDPKTKPGKERPPAWMKGDGLAEWKRMVPLLKNMGIFAAEDRVALEVYCQAYHRWRQAEQAIEDAEDLMVETPNGHLQAQPLLTIARKYADQAVRLATEFGLTPSSRAGVDGDRGGAEDPDDAFFSRNNRGGSGKASQLTH